MPVKNTSAVSPIPQRRKLAVPRPRAAALPALLMGMALAAWAPPCLAAPPEISPFTSSMAWRAVNLPGGKVPASQLEAVTLDGSKVLRLEAHQSYGTWVHTLPTWVPEAASTLQWRWRLDLALDKSDLRRKDGDDAALKVCLMFDLPLQAVPFTERAVLRMARAISGEVLPAATLCYVWDPKLPVGTVLPNAYSRRVRYIVAEGTGTPLGQWRSAVRHVHADFLMAFGDESSTVPAVTAIAVGADADNTGGQSLAYISDLRLLP